MKRFLGLWTLAGLLMLTLPSVSAQTAATQSLPPKMEVVLKSANPDQIDLIQSLKKDVSLVHIEKDEYQAQTDFLYKRAETEIRNALRAKGYYSVSIQPSIIRTPDSTRASFEIDAGAPVKIRKLDLQILGEGKDLFAWRHYQQFELSLKSGDRLSHQNYQDTLRELSNIAINEGFIDMRFDRREFKVYPSEYIADIHIHLNTQNAYQFGEIEFSGSEQIQPYLLKRYIEIEPGEKFNRDRLSELQKQLINSRYFSMVRIEPKFQQTESRQIPVEIQLEDNPPHRYNVGGGYGSDTGARLVLGFENRLVNRQGHNYQIDSIVGERHQSFQINYRIPGFRPARQTWNLGAISESTQSDSLSITRSALTPEYIYQLDEEWRLSSFVSLEMESFQYDRKTKEFNQALLFGINVQKRKTNNEAYPTQGYRHNAGFRISSDSFFSDSEFIQLDFSTRFVYSPLDFWRLHARGQTALTLAQSQSLIPASYRYLLGGESLRGFEFESIGIASADGSIEGARNMLQGSLETDYRLTNYFGGGLFIDAGQVFETTLPDHLLIGAGFGLRSFIPVGTIKLDIAWPISEKEVDWRLHFSIGLDL